MASFNKINQFVEDLAKKVHNLNSDTLKVMLTNTAPNASTNAIKADITEISAGNGYTAGGITLTSVALTQTAGVVKFTSAAAVWTASGGSIPAWRYAVVRAVGTLNGKVDPIVGYFLGDSTPADVPATTDTNTLTITPNASGIMSAT